jgi:hypothetical protein
VDIIYGLGLKKTIGKIMKDVNYLGSEIFDRISAYAFGPNLLRNY